MPALVQRLAKRELISPPEYVVNQTQYEVISGSVSYGVSNNTSDIDVVGFCVPPKDMVFPHLAGEIIGFGRQIQRFGQYQQHHINDPSNQKEYDITIYSIIKYFQLCMDNNPNMLDSLFSPRRCVISSTPLGELVREHRRLFLHKGGYHKFRGYCFSQLHKAKTKKRKGLQELVEFEEQHNIPNITTLDDVEKELENRGLM